MHSGNAPWRNNLLRAFYACCEHAEIEGGEQNGSVDIHSIRGDVRLAQLRGWSGSAGRPGNGRTFDAADDDERLCQDDRSGEAEGIAALPFASVSDPDHIVSMEDALGEAE